MRRGKATHQMSMQMELALNDHGGEASVEQRSGEAGRAAQEKERSGNHHLLMEQVVDARMRSWHSSVCGETRAVRASTG
jgi:hypothetical protein